LLAECSSFSRWSKQRLGGPVQLAVQLRLRLFEALLACRPAARTNAIRIIGIGITLSKRNQNIQKPFRYRQKRPRLREKIRRGDG
jgi:hypothetical protein